MLVLSRAVFVATTALAVALAAAPAGAQNTAPPTNSGQSQSSAPKRALNDVLARMSTAAGVSIVADSTVGNLSVTPPAEPTTPANFEPQIAELVRQLPRTATWARLYLPAPTPGARPYKGDDVADFALAQARLFGRVGAEDRKTVEVLGQPLPAEQTATVLTALRLQPIFLVSDPASRAAAEQARTTAANAPAGWSRMTDAEKQAYVRAEAQKILNMDPAYQPQAVQDLMGYSRAVMGAVLQSMTSEQRSDFWRNMGILDGRPRAGNPPGVGQ